MVSKIIWEANRGLQHRKEDESQMVQWEPKVLNKVTIPGEDKEIVIKCTCTSIAGRGPPLHNMLKSTLKTEEACSSKMFVLNY
jgi:hypothetical protein